VPHGPNTMFQTEEKIQLATTFTYRHTIRFQRHLKLEEILKNYDFRSIFVKHCKSAAEGKAGIIHFEHFNLVVQLMLTYSRSI